MIKNLITLLTIAIFLVNCGGEETVKNDSADNDKLLKVKKQIKYYRDSMKTAGVDHLSFYSLEYVSHKDDNSKSKDNSVFTLGEFAAIAGDYVEKEINVAGIVDHVCKHGGKKILLVSDEGDTHVFSKNRFDDKIVGSKIIVAGIVKEDRIDEAYLLKWEEDAINKHNSSDETNETDENK